LEEKPTGHTSIWKGKRELNITGIRHQAVYREIMNIKNQISENLFIFDEPD